MKKLNYVAVAVYCILFVGMVSANQLEEYSEKFETRLETINTETSEKLVVLQQKVKDALNKLLADEKRQGNLDQVKAVMTAIKEFDTTRIVTEDQMNDAFPKLKRLYTLFQQQVYRLEDETAQRIKLLTQKYDNALKKLQKELTRQGDIEGAIAVQDVRMTLQDDMAPGRASSGNGEVIGKDVSKSIGVDLKHGAIYSGLKELLDEKGYNVVFIDSEINDDVLSEVEALLLISPTKLFSDEEVQAVEDFVSKGGGLLCAGQAWSWTYKEYGDSPIESYPLNNVGKAMDFWVTGLNIGAPTHVESDLLSGQQDVVRNGWWPSKIEVNGKDSQVLIRDNDFRPIAGCQPYGKGRIIIYGHGGLLKDNPDILSRSLEYIRQEI